MTSADGAPRYAVAGLEAHVANLFRAGGLDAEKAAVVAQVLVEADLMGHTTHGLQLAAPYLRALDDGSMTADGEPEVVTDRGATVVWGGRRLPGTWLTVRAVDLAIERAASHGVACVVVRDSHHIACLAVYLRRAAERGCMVMVASSDPSVVSVAPYGGTRPTFTPNPLGVGYPTDGDPVLIDVSASITTNGMVDRAEREGRRLPGKWLLDASGHASDDPAVVRTDPPGSLLPIGGMDYGHKGFGLALMIEAMTQGLAGFGRAEPPRGWGASVFVQVMDPALFAGADAFARETGWMARACRASPTVPGVDAVRMPGDRALARRRRALAEGVALYPGIIEALRPFAERAGLAPPTPIVGAAAGPSA
ncbi:MAG: Ldh family oxidoreductase [Chromatiales bacterium]|nr:Ldh family oxidoreductase [Chromatiales bacterium]